MNRTKGSIAKWQDAQRAVIEGERKIITMPMDYDKVSSGTWRKNIALFDYVRYREIELLAEELDRNNIPGAVAEAGVDMGQTSVFLNTLFPERRLYLYDTFERFPQEALDTEFKGTKEAVEAAKKEFGDFITFPLPDQGGSLIIPKMLSPLPGT